MPLLILHKYAFFEAHQHNLLELLLSRKDMEGTSSVEGCHAVGIPAVCRTVLLLKGRVPSSPEAIFLR